MFHLKMLVFFILAVTTLSFGAPTIRSKDRTEVELIARNIGKNAMKKAAYALAQKIKHKFKDLKEGEPNFYSGSRLNKKTGSMQHVKPDAVKFGKKHGGHILSHHLVEKKLWIAKNEYAPWLWKVASESAAKNANGKISSIVGERRKKSIYDTIEKPILMKNPRVTQLTEYHVDSAGNLTPKVVKKS